MAYLLKKLFPFLSVMNTVRLISDPKSHVSHFLHPLSFWFSLWFTFALLILSSVQSLNLIVCNTVIILYRSCLNSFAVLCCFFYSISCRPIWSSSWWLFLSNLSHFSVSFYGFSSYTPWVLAPSQSWFVLATFTVPVEQDELQLLSFSYLTWVLSVLTMSWCG
jgi:hypothetical protein